MQQVETQTAGMIVSICYTQDTADYKRPEDHYARTPIESTELVAGGGITGDRKGKYKDREINLMAAETLEGLSREGFKTGPGQMGEQIVVRGVDVNHLKPGDRVRLGETAILEVDKARTGCDRFEHIQGQPKSRVQGRLGQMMRVITGGAIRVGDSAKKQ
jgi:MOSC domain-containing protein YiiM